MTSASVPQTSDAAPNQTTTGGASLLFPFLDLKAQFATIRDETMGAVARVMESQEFILGREVRLFEEEAATMLGARYAISCASCSDALVLALMALNIGAGDQVVTTPFTFGATAGSIARLGAKPIFVDIDPDTYNIEPTQLESAITPRTRALMPVHLFGLPANLGLILDIARRHGLEVIEDAAQAIGARYGDRAVGTFGILGCFSFFPSKNLGCAGDGGLIVTNDAGLAEKLRLLRAHGSAKKYHYEILGMNSRLDAIQAAILRVKLDRLNSWTDARQSHARRYCELFETAGLTDRIKLPRLPATPVSHVYNQFSIRCSRRDELRDYLRRGGIPTEIYYPLPLHLQPAFSPLGYRRGQFPIAESACEQILSLPVYPEMADWQQVAVVRAIAEFYSAKNQVVRLGFRDIELP
jgi:dTDP-4-amino-4,6-dideoxygalactose transaminase